MIQVREVRSGPPVAVEPPLDPPGGRGASAAHYLSLVVGGILLVRWGRTHWFFADEWEFIVNRGVTGRPALGLLVPHTQHWSTGPILIWRALLAVFGLQSYLPYLLANVAVHLAVVHLAWRLAGRAGVRTWTRTAVAALFLFSVTNGFNAFWAFQISFNGTVAIGLGLLLLAERRARPSTARLGAIAVLAVVMMTFSSIALALLVGVGALLLVRQGWRTAAIGVGPAGAAFVAWYLLIGRDPLPGDRGSGLNTAVSGSLLGPAARFVGHGLAAAIGDPVFIGTALSVVALIGVAAWSVLHRGDLVGRAAGPACAALAAVVFFVTAAVARSTSGAHDPTQARYLYVAGALLVPLVAVCIDSVLAPLTARVRVLGPIALAVAVVLCGINAVRLRDLAERQGRMEQVLAGRVLDAAAQIRAGEPYLPGAIPEPQFDIDVDMRDLVRLADQGLLPTRPPLSEPERSIVRVQSQVGLGKHPGFEVPGSVRVVGSGGVELVGTGDGCVTMTQSTEHGALVVATDRPTSLQLVTSGPVELLLSLRTADGGWLPATRGMALPGGVRWLDLGTTGYQAALSLPAGAQVHVCGLRM